MITARQVIALRTRLAALAYLSAGELFQSAMQLFDLPTHVVRFLSDLRGNSLKQLICDELVNAAVCGNELE